MRTIIAALIILIIAGCTEQPEVIPYEYSKIFTGDTKKGWSIRSYQYTEEGKATQTGKLDDCLSDDLYILFANEERRVEIRDNSNKCVEDDPDLLFEGSWSFVNTNATLSLPFPLLTSSVPALPFIVREVAEDRMTLEIFLDDEGTTSYRFNFTAQSLKE
jgi:hypothetical protein